MFLVGHLELVELGFIIFQGEYLLQFCPWFWNSLLGADLLSCFLQVSRVNVQQTSDLVSLKLILQSSSSYSHGAAPNIVQGGSEVKAELGLLLTLPSRTSLLSTQKWLLSFCFPQGRGSTNKQIAWTVPCSRQSLAIFWPCRGEPGIQLSWCIGRKLFGFNSGQRLQP